jgi:hypothetical protein
MNRNVLYRLCALALLVSIGAHRLVAMQRPAGVEPYHANIRAVAATAPMTIGGWVGRDIAVPTQAISVLAPNAIISRQYTNVETGLTATVLLVHCSDAHDMAGHFPLRCYPASGWQRRRAEPRDWAVGDLLITGTEYEFYQNERIGQSQSERAVAVVNCLLRPGGNILRDMDDMAKSIVGAGGQASGSGQIQVCFDARVPQAKRDQAATELIEGFRPTICAILETTQGEIENTK